jgi:spore coat protein A
MAFRVSKPLSGVPLTTLPVSLRPLINRLPAPVKTRQLILFEGMDQYGRLMTLLGTPQQGGLHFFDPITERPVLGTVEVWEILNTTVDAHPIHVHMVKMQLLNRQKFSANVNITTGQITGPIQFKGAAKGPGLDERGWKDTYIMNPGEVTRITTRFDIPGPSAWHCHILSHEDHEMMRPYEIVGPAATAAKTTSESITEIEKQLQFKVMPNPFTDNLLVNLNLSSESTVVMNVYDIKGSKVGEVFNGKRQAGMQLFTIDGNQWANGTYLLEVLVDNQRMLRKLVLQK